MDIHRARAISKGYTRARAQLLSAAHKKYKDNQRKESIR